jgi:hypothetical protein
MVLVLAGATSTAEEGDGCVANAGVTGRVKLEAADDAVSGEAGEFGASRRQSMIIKSLRGESRFRDPSALPVTAK